MEQKKPLELPSYSVQLIISLVLCATPVRARIEFMVRVRFKARVRVRVRVG